MGRLRHNTGIFAKADVQSAVEIAGRMIAPTETKEVTEKNAGTRKAASFWHGCL